MSFNNRGLVDIFDVTPGIREVTMTWKAYPGATQYRLTFTPITAGLSSGKERVVVMGGSGDEKNMSHSFASLKGGQQYRFGIRAGARVGNSVEYTKLNTRDATPFERLNFESAEVLDQSLVQNIQMVTVTLPEVTEKIDGVTYGLSPELPEGIEFDATTRTLTGTATAALEKKSFTYSAEHTSGEKIELTFNLSVLGFDKTTIIDRTLILNDQINAITLPEAVGEGDVTYSLSPELPEGIEFDASTRTLTGTPITTFEKTDFTYSVEHTSGEKIELTFSLSVLGFNVATIADSTFLLNSQMNTIILPEAIGGSDVTYSLSPELPEGIEFDVTTRMLTGKPTVAIEKKSFTYTAQNSDGKKIELTLGLSVRPGIEKRGVLDHRLPIPKPSLTAQSTYSTYEPLVKLSIDDLGDNNKYIRVYRVTGKDIISSPFRYEIHLVYAGVPKNADNEQMIEFMKLNPADVLEKDATLSISVFDGSNEDGRASRPLHGFIDEFSELSVQGVLNTEYHYRLTLKPRFARLARNRQSRIHATSGQPQILASLISDKMTATGTDYKAPKEGEAGLVDIAATQGHAILTSSDFNTTEIQHEGTTGLGEIMNLSHVTQYDETDLDFISRICEQRGVYYYFEHDTSLVPGAGDIVRFCNGTNLYETEGAPQRIWLRESDPGNPQSTAHQKTGTTGLLITGSLYSFRRVVRPRPKKILMKSYNPNNPNLSLEVDQSVPSGESGVLVDHGTPFLTRAAGEEYAKIRAQEVFFKTDYYEGTTTSPWVSPGSIFRRIASHALPAETLDSLTVEQLSELPASDLQTGGTDKYLVTHSDVEITQLPCLGLSDPDGNALQRSFTNKIRCVNVYSPADSTINPLHYRPPRITPVPKLPGVYEAHVDAPYYDSDTDKNRLAKRAHLDDKGAYRLRHVDDARTHIDRAAGSMPVPKLEPYIGSDGVGMHFPLRKGTTSNTNAEGYKGTEVLVGYRDGNPDRPVILGGVPNETHQSPTNADAPYSNRIRTFSGSLLELHDGEAGSESEARVLLRSQTVEDGIGGSYFRIGYPDKDQEKLFAPRLSFSVPYAQPNEPTTTELQEQSGLLSYTPDHMIREAGGEIRDHANNIVSRALKDNFIEGKRLYLSGNAKNFSVTRPNETDDTDVTISGDGNIKISSTHGEMLVSSHRKLILTSDTDDIDLISPARLTVSSGDKEEVIKGDEKKIVHADTDKWQMGRDTSGIMGAKTSTFLGANTSVSLANHCSLKVAGFQSISVGAGLTVKPQSNLTIYGKKLEIVALSEVKYATNVVRATSAAQVVMAAAKVTTASVSSNTTGVNTRVTGLETTI